MADFSNVGAKIVRMTSAHDVLRMIRDLYRQAQQVSTLIEKYQTDLDFKASVDHLYTEDQINELKNMVQDATVLKNHWETDHASVVTAPADTVFVL